METIKRTIIVRRQMSDKFGLKTSTGDHIEEQVKIWKDGEDGELQSIGSTRYTDQAGRDTTLIIVWACLT